MLIYLFSSSGFIQYDALQIKSDMQQLKQLLTYKLKLLERYRITPTNPTQQQQLSELLLKEKRKQTSRDVIQSRLIQSLCTRRIEAPYRIEEFYNLSLNMMKMYEPLFEASRSDLRSPREKDLDSRDNDSVGEIVGLYVKFFHEQGSERRAEQLINIYEKNLCERGVIIPTLFNWFAEWLRKIFKDFLKRTLNMINEKKNPKVIQQNKKNRNRKFMQQLSMQRASLSLIDSQIKLHKLRQISLSGNKSKLLNPSQNQIKIGTRNISRSDIAMFKHNQYKSLSKLKINQSVMQQSLLQPLDQPPLPLPSSFSMPIKEQPNQINIKQRRVSTLNLNKDIFFSAFYEEMGNYYKMNNCLGELDENYPRSFRKVDRRDEINKNIGVLVKSMARNQPNEIKNTIETYYSSYEVKFGPVQSKKRAQSEKPIKHVKRSQSVSISKDEKQVQKEIRKSNHSVEITPKQRNKSLTRMSAQKTKIQLELPLINNPTASALPPQSYRSVERIAIADLLPSRYSKQRDKERVSAEIYKELRQINSLFRNKSKNKQTFTQATEMLEIGSNSIKYKSGVKDEVGELLDGHFEASGVFRLPRIGK